MRNARPLNIQNKEIFDHPRAYKKVCSDHLKTNERAGFVQPYKHIMCIKKISNVIAVSMGAFDFLLSAYGEVTIN